MPVFKTEITSDTIPSDNPIHQRLLKPYVVVRDLVRGTVLELGCGEGRGVTLLADRPVLYTGLDKISEVVEQLKIKFPGNTFYQAHFPPLDRIESDSFDSVISFQVIEHIRDDNFFLREIYRVLRPGGKAYITTPNRDLTLTRNPWHIREYTSGELTSLCRDIFDEVEMQGIAGNQKVMTYYEKNKRSVKNITRFDILNLQYRLPAFLLKVPYELMNRINRNHLKSESDELVRAINHEDYLVNNHPERSLDLFAILGKK